jgi:hypothetical protein
MLQEVSMNPSWRWRDQIPRRATEKGQKKKFRRGRGSLCLIAAKWHKHH